MKAIKYTYNYDDCKVDRIIGSSFWSDSNLDEIVYYLESNDDLSDDDKEYEGIWEIADSAFIPKYDVYMSEVHIIELPE